MECYDRYDIVIKSICKIKGIKREQLLEILKDNDCRYLLFLLLKKYNCADTKRLDNEFNINNKEKIDCEINKAKEKFMINIYFRNMYFEVDDIVNKIIRTKNHIL